MANRDVRLDDVRRLFQVLGDARDFIDGQGAQLHILEGLCRILHARVATSGLVTGLDRGAFELARSEYVGISTTEAMTLFSPYASRGANGDPLLSRMLSRPRIDGVQAYRRCDLVSDAEWHGDAVVADVRAPMRLDDTIHACFGSGRGAVVGLQIVRDAVDGSFDERDRNLVELLLLEAGARLAPGESPGSKALTPRERQTLECLLSGDSEKQAAAKLGLSVHTLHDHVKRLYRLFGVTSRSELMARVLGPRSQ